MSYASTLIPAFLAALLLAGCAGERAAPAPETRDLREGPALPEPPPEPAPALINAAGLAIIEESEGLRLEAYELAGQWLIGYGHAATAAPGMTITEGEAEALLRQDLRDTEEGVDRLVSAPLNDNEFSALVSLAYNLGLGGFSRTLVYERLEAGDRAGAADAFLYLDSAVIDGERRELPALKERREKERALFLTPARR